MSDLWEWLNHTAPGGAVLLLAVIGLLVVARGLWWLWAPGEPFAGSRLLILRCPNCGADNIANIYPSTVNVIVGCCKCHNAIEADVVPTLIVRRNHSIKEGC